MSRLCCEGIKKTLVVTYEPPDETARQWNQALLQLTSWHTKEDTEAATAVDVY